MAHRAGQTSGTRAPVGGCLTETGGFRLERVVGEPVLLVAGAVDNLAPPEVVRFSYDQVASPDKTYRMFGRVNGHKADYGHNDLILGKHSREEVFPLIAQWLTERARPRAPGRP